MPREKPPWESLWEMNRLIIIGASGHGKVVADIARLCGYIDIVFLDNNQNLKTCAGYQVLGPDDMAHRLDGDIFIAVGNASIRQKLMKRYFNRKFPALVHPKSVLADDTKVGAGSVIMAGAVVNADVNIGKGCIINTSSSIDHDCVISDFVHVAVGAHVCGTVAIGEGTWVGAGSTVINNVNVCGGCMIGAGAVVVKDITEAGTYIGLPASKVSNGEKTNANCYFH